MANENWSREQIILALELYYRTPYGRISSHNQEICELADLIGRTVGAVVRKMGNLAHHDPVIRAQNKVGLSHGGKLDGIVFEEFSENLGELSRQARLIREKLGAPDIDKYINLDEFSEIPEGEYKKRMIKTRLGQSAFRKSVLGLFGNKCCVTGLYLPQMLVASHIKPWADSDEGKERTNPRNGLCLNAFHDRLFDQGLMTINKKYEVVLSSKIKDAKMDMITRDWLAKYEGKEIMIPKYVKPEMRFIEYHNDIVFQK